MRFQIAGISTFALALVLIGCGAATPGATLAPGQTASPPPQTTPAPTVPGATGGVALTGHECDAIPTFSLSSFSLASPPPDTTLLAHFPATIDGQPLTDVQSEQWLYFLCLTGGQAALQSAANEGGSSFNLATMSFGSATATVDGESVDLHAWRTPNQDASGMINSLATLAALQGSAVDVGNVQQVSIGGKNVYSWTDTDGTKNFIYPSGDTLIFFDSVTDSQATKILTALP